MVVGQIGINGHCLDGNEVRLDGLRSKSGEEVLPGFLKSPESLSFTCDGQISKGILFDVCCFGEVTNSARPGCPI